MILLFLLLKYLHNIGWQNASSNTVEPAMKDPIWKHKYKVSFYA